jgi:EpsI family protein
VTQFALVTMLVLAVPSVLGWTVARAMTFPLGFLFFAVPMGDFLLPLFMEWTAEFTIVALRWSGIPVYREGLHFVIPSGSWSVVEACSGIRYLIASLTVGCLFAYLSYRSLTKRLVFVGFSILVPIVANWLRAYMIVMIGHLSGNELATGVDHLIYGWVFFGLVIVVMLFVGARWADAPLSDAGGPSAAPVQPQSVWMPRPAAGRQSGMAALLVAILVASPHAVERVLSLGTITTPVQLATLQPAGPWTALQTPPSSWVPAFNHVPASSHAGFQGPQAQPVGLHLSYYRQQNYERKLVSSENVLVKSQDERWAQVATDRQDAVLAGRPLAVSSTTLRQQGGGVVDLGQRLQAWRFYWVNHRFTSSDTLAKIQGAWGRITGQGDDSAIVVIYTPLNPQLPEAEARKTANAVLQDFLKTQGEALQTALQQTRGAR